MCTLRFYAYKIIVFNIEKQIVFVEQSCVLYIFFKKKVFQCVNCYLAINAVIFEMCQLTAGFGKLLFII